MYERVKTSKRFPENIAKALEIEGYTPKMANKLIDLLSTTKYRQKDAEDLLRMYFEENLTLSEIGNKYNLSKERIRQKIFLSLYDIRRRLAAEKK